MAQSKRGHQHAILRRQHDRAYYEGKRLKKHLQAAGYDVKLTQCYRLLAQMMGFRGWQELTASVGTEEASLGDDYVDDAEFERRRQFQLSVLLDEGIGRDDAEAAIDATRPTNCCLPTAGPSADEEAFAEEWGFGPVRGTEVETS